MNLRQYLLTFGIGTLIAWAAWLIILLNTDPASASIGFFIVFYITLFIGLVGFFTTIATIIRARRYKKRDFEDAIKRSVRQGVMLTILVIGNLILASQSLLTWLTAVLLIVVIGLIEFFFLSAQSKKEAV
ncbi:MAG: hypothetical protein ABH846_00630 [Patescibacteria group bacterium]